MQERFPVRTGIRPARLQFREGYASRTSARDDFCAVPRMSDPPGTFRIMPTLVLGTVFGAALTLTIQLIIQFYVVPKVEARKRREERWEHNVLDLGELLTTSLGDRAQEAFLEQSGFRHVRQLESAVGVDHDRVARLRSEQILKARQATAAFNNLAHTRVPWLVDRVASVGRASDEIVQFENAARRYRIQAIYVDDWSEDYDSRTDITFDEAWDQERDARRALARQVNTLLDLRHPPRASLRRRWWRWGTVRVRQAIAWAGIGVRRALNPNLREPG